MFFRKPSLRFLLFTFLFTSLTAVESTGQDPDADSVFAPILKIEQETVRFQKNYAQCIQFLFDWRGKLTAQKARPYAEEILNQAVKKGDKAWIARSELALAGLLFLEASDKEAFLLVEKNEPVLKKLKDYQALSELLYLKGHLYRAIDQYDKMYQYWNEGLDIARKHKLYFQWQQLLVTMANDYGEVKEFDKAEALFTEALKLPLSPSDLARIYSDFSIHFAKSRQMKKAHLYADSALEIARKHDLKDLFSIFYFNQATMAMDERKLDEAEKLAMLSMSHNQGENRLDHAMKSYAFLKDLWFQKKDYLKAYQFGEKFYRLRDSLKASQRQIEFRELDKKYQTAVKEKTIQEQKQLLENKEQQRKILLFGLSTLAIISLLGGVVFYLNRKRKEIKLQQARMESELKALRAQMNPHFMFNSLNAIQQMVLNNENQEAFRYLDTYSKLTRQILENSEKSWVSVKDEIRFLELYLQMESLRFDHAFQWKIEVDDSVSPHSDQIPAMLIQPLVENAIKHGLLPKEGEKKVHIRFSRPNEMGLLQVEVEDNGVGRKQAVEKVRQTDHQSMSLSITENRLRLLGGDLAGGIEVEDLKDATGKPLGTKVRFGISD